MGKRFVGSWTVASRTVTSLKSQVASRVSDALNARPRDMGGCTARRRSDLRLVTAEPAELTWARIQRAGDAT